jgi:hypothetical protein
MRLQLKRPAHAAALGIGALLAAVVARADGGEVDVGATLFHEGGGGLNMTVVTPSVRGRVDPVDEVTVRVGWDADVVSGASVAVVDAPGTRPDAITTATYLDDLRNVFSGGLELRSDFGSLRAGYAYGFESDYVSHALTLGARAELFERNTTFDLSYAHGWDSVCDVAQPRMQEPVERRRLPSSMTSQTSSISRTSRLTKPGAGSRARRGRRPAIPPAHAGCPTPTARACTPPLRAPCRAPCPARRPPQPSSISDLGAQISDLGAQPPSFGRDRIWAPCWA